MSLGALLLYTRVYIEIFNDRLGGNVQWLLRCKCIGGITPSN